jgi:hypothetical protein
MFGFALSYAENMFIIMILGDFCFLPAAAYGKLKAVCKSRASVHLGKFAEVRITLFCMSCNSKS